ncbi:MAG: IMP cyclohydrolase [Clostridia bacterium]|nr:IMP cyclohydrolase [Clostridia bacterium]
MLELKKNLTSNVYPGRGIIVGKTPDGKNAAVAYFIMGRSENSRNRIFEKQEGGIIIYPFDESKVADPSLIIYSPVRTIDNNLIVTNGDQTDTVYDFVKDGKAFEEALLTRCFEPDAPNFTPRISAMLTFADGDFTYKMSILKKNVGCDECDRFTFDFAAAPGRARFIHTYMGDGNPIPSFYGEPEQVETADDIDEFTKTIWESLNEQNKISLYVRYVSLADGSVQERMINKNQK